MKKLLVFIGVLGLMTAMTLTAGALEYTIEAPGHPDYGKPTSVESVITADQGARKNEDLSKNAALVPPTFGSPAMDAKMVSPYLTPNLVSGGMYSGAVINGGSVSVMTPGSVVPTTPSTSVGFTEVNSDLYYNAGHLGTLKIPALDLSVRIYQGTDAAALRKGVGHFEETSIWIGNVALAAHNRGANNYFGQIHTLDFGDTIRLSTKLGERTYKVVSVEKVQETDRSSLAATVGNCLTLYTCVRDQSSYRWCVRAVEV